MLRRLPQHCSAAHLQAQSKQGKNKKTYTARESGTGAVLALVKAVGRDGVSDRSAQVHIDYKVCLVVVESKR